MGPLPATTDRKGLPLSRLITELPINSSPAPVDLCSDSDMGIGSFPLPPAIYLHLLINGNLNPVTRILLALRAGGLSPAGMELQLAAAPCSLLQSCVSVNKCRVSRSSGWSEDLLWLRYSVWTIARHLDKINNGEWFPILMSIFFRMNQEMNAIFFFFTVSLYAISLRFLNCMDWSIKTATWFTSIYNSCLFCYIRFYIQTWRPPAESLPQKAVYLCQIYSYLFVPENPLWTIILLLNI